MNKNSSFIRESYGDYLKAIYILALDETPVSTSSLAKEMKVSNASASDMIRRLSKENYADHLPYKGVSLTTKGEKIALSLLRRHRLWEVFLKNTLKIPSENVHQYAELLEHVTDDSLEEYLDAFLGYPEKDPHGCPIPRKDGTVASIPQCRLSELKEGQQAEIIQFREEEPSLLKYLYDVGIELGTNVKIEKKISYDNSLQLQIDGKSICLGEKITTTLIVKLL
ncbi:metal-dependent transcriptional regulator [Candidatus Uabimicrobium amorphum]|uniref:Transcriptional regulator MntR n=1 Tax=Uabimicrobium amorphum TaxID=2596890 RepID=A0A5S9IK78_UABAM|nr:metal-dependent transcriptional regulator [Candidatus Uabimicrobium amorphum]BBM82976.1 iron-dependent repressor [Candidatus Uabimicrobium amorphum]